MDVPGASLLMICATFKSLYRLGVLIGMQWSGADAREPELLENTTQTHFREVNPKTLANDALEVDAAPAHHCVRVRVGAGLDQLLEQPLVLVGQPRRPPRRLDVDQTIRAMLVEAVCPVPQRLPVHPANPRRLGAVHSVENRRQSQQTTGLGAALRPRRKTANILRRKIGS